MSSRGYLEHVRIDRKMPFLRRGMQTDMNGKKGVVCGGNSHCNLQVRFDGQKFSSNVHPWWEMTYYASDGSVIRDYKAGV